MDSQALPSLALGSALAAAAATPTMRAARMSASSGISGYRQFSTSVRLPADGPQVKLIRIEIEPAHGGTTKLEG